MEFAQIAQIIVALYLLWMGTNMTTKNAMSAFVFNTLPMIFSFVLGLIAFKVI